MDRQRPCRETRQTKEERTGARALIRPAGADLLYLAQRGTATYVPVRTISSLLQIPQHYLAKVLQQLVQCGIRGILKLLRDPHGGVALARSADEIVLMDIIRILDEVPVLKQCLIDLPGCTSPAACLLGEQRRATL